MKVAAAFPLLLVAGCGSSADPQQRQASAVAAPGLECATDGASSYGAGCTIERGPGPAGAILTIRSPTGSFRRLRVVAGRIEAAAGAEPAHVLADDGGRVEVAIGGDRYRIPREALR